MIHLSIGRSLWWCITGHLKMHGCSGGNQENHKSIVWGVQPSTQKATAARWHYGRLSSIHMLIKAKGNREGENNDGHKSFLRKFIHVTWPDYGHLRLILYAEWPDRKQEGREWVNQRVLQEILTFVTIVGAKVDEAVLIESQWHMIYSNWTGVGFSSG